jgi:transaldolase
MACLQFALKIQSEAVLQQIDELGIDMETIAQQLEDEGLEKFIQPFDVLLETLESKLG